MKNLKKFLAVVLAVAMIATSMAAVFAADTADPLAEKYPEAALMRDLGILNGGSTGVTEAYLKQRPVRIQAAILTLRLMGKEKDALAYNGLAHFTDKIPDTYWAKNVMGYLKANPAYGWRGDNYGRLNPEEKITKEEFAKVLLTAMGYQQGIHYEWEGVMTAYKAAGLTALENVDSDAITMNDIAIAINEALRTPVRGSSTETLAWRLSLVNPEFKAAALAKGLIQPVTIKSVVNPDLGTVEEGAVVFPPAQVLATMSDGSTKMVDVKWAAEKFDTSKVGDVTLKGTIDGYSAGATAKVKVIAASVKSVEEVVLSDAYVGQEVVLPATVKAIYSNGTVANVPVTWDPATVDTSKEAELTFKGTVAGYKGEIVATMKVLKDEIAEVAVKDVTIKEGAALALPAEVDATYKSGKVEKVAVVWDTSAVKTNVPGTYEVVGKIGDYETKVKVVVEPVALDFTLSADNYKEVTVSFNKPVNPDVITAGNFAVTGNTITNVSLIDDRTVRILVANKISGQGKFEVTVKAAVGLASDTTKSTGQVIDATVPTVVSVEPVGNSVIKVTFSEPVDNFTSLINYKLNGAYFAASVPTIDATGRVLTITPTTRLAAGVNKLSIANVKDFAGWVIAPVEKEFVVAQDTTAPSFVAVESATQTKVVIVMSEAIVTPADSDVVSTPNETGRSVDGSKLILTYGTGANAVPVAGMTVTLKNITDLFGNKAGDMTVSIPAPTLDLVRPTFVSAVAEGSTNAAMKIVATFSEDVLVSGNFTLKNSDGVVVATGPVTRYQDADGNNVATKLYVAGNIPAGDYKLSISGVKDASGLENEMIPVTDVIVTVPDKTAPAVAKWYKNAEGTKLYVQFDSAVSEASAENKANYSYIDAGNYAKALNADTTVTLLADGKTVEIALTGEAIVYLQVSGVADASGNTMATVNKALAGFEAMPTDPTATAKVVDKNTVELTVIGSLISSTVNISDFAVKTAAGATLTIYSAVSADNKITLKVVEDIAADGKYQNSAVQVEVKSNASSKDVFGQSLTAGTINAADGIAPSISLTSASGTSSGTVITLTASEALTTVGTPVVNVIVDGVLKAATVTVNASVMTINVAEDLSGKTANIKYFKSDANKYTDGVNDLPSFEISATVE